MTSKIWKKVLRESPAYSWNYSLKSIRAIRFIDEIYDSTIVIPELYTNSHMKYIKSCSKVRLVLIGNRKHKSFQRIARFSCRFHKTIKEAQYTLKRTRFLRFYPFSSITKCKITFEQGNKEALSNEDLKVFRKALTSSKLEKISIDCLEKRTITFLRRFSHLKALNLRTSLENFLAHQQAVNRTYFENRKNDLELFLFLTTDNDKKVSNSLNRSLKLATHIRSLGLQVEGHSRIPDFWENAGQLVNLSKFSYTETDNPFSNNPLKNLQDLNNLTRLDFMFNLSHSSQNFLIIFASLPLSVSLRELTLTFHNINTDVSGNPTLYLANLERLSTLQNLRKFGLKITLHKIVSKEVQSRYVSAVTKALENLREGLEDLKIDLSDFTLEESPLIDKGSDIVELILRQHKLKSLEVRLPIVFEKPKSETRIMPEFFNIKTLVLKDCQGFADSLLKYNFRTLEHFTFTPGRSYDTGEACSVIRAIKFLTNLRKIEFVVTIKEKQNLTNDLFEEIKNTFKNLKYLTTMHICLSNLNVTEAQAMSTLSLIRWKRSLRASSIKLGQYSFHRGAFDLSGLFYF